MTGLIEQIARAVVEEAEQACRYVAKRNLDSLEEGPYRDGFETACEVCEAAISANVQRHIDRIADQIRPIIQAAIAAETERCARVAEDHCYSIDIGTWAAMTKKEHSAYACDSIAAAIRSKT